MKTEAVSRAEITKDIKVVAIKLGQNSVLGQPVA